MLTDLSLTLPALPVVGSRRRTATRRAQVALARRLWDLQEVTQILCRASLPGRRPRYSIDTVRSWVARGELPAVVLPPAWASDKGRPGWRTYRIPDVWIADWFAMRDRDEPRFTDRDELGRDDEPPWINFNDAGLAIGISHETMREFVRIGVVEAHSEPSGRQVISTRTLDDWVWRMIHNAELEWFGVLVPEAMQAVPE